MLFLQMRCVQVQVNLRGGGRTYVERMVHTCSSVAVYNVYNNLYVLCQDSSVNLITIFTINYTYYNTLIVFYII